MKSPILPLLASLLATTLCTAQDDPPAKRPLPSGPEAVTETAVTAQFQTFLTTCLIDDYRSRCGDREPDAEFEALLRAWTKDTQPLNRYIAGVIDRAAHRAPPDPLMYWLAAETDAGDAAQQRKWFDHAIAELRRLGAMPASRLLVALRARQRLGDADGDPYLEAYCDAMVACAGDRRMAGIGQRWMFGIFRALWPSVDSNARGLIGRMLAVKAEDRYAALALDGWCHCSEAWDARSSRAATQVTRKGWKGFEEHLEAAAESLIQAYRLHPEFPEAPAKMITVCGGSGAIDEIRGWLDAAVAAQFDYHYAYASALHFYSARWGGSPKLQLDLGRECAATERYDTVVPQLLRNAIGDLANDTQKDLRDAFTPKIQERLDAMHERRMAELKTVPEANWELSLRGVELIMFRRSRAGVELLQSLGDQANMEACESFGGVPRFIGRVREELAAPYVPVTVAPVDLFAGWEEPTYPGAAARRPLPTGADQPTEMQAYVAWSTFLAEMTEAHYRRLTTDDEAVRPRVVAAIGEFPSMLTQRPGAPTPPQFLSTLDQLRKDGATDPLLLYYEARALDLLGRTDNAIDKLRASQTGMQQGGYGPLFQLFALRRQVQLIEQSGNAAALPELRREASRLAREAAHMTEWDADHRQFYLSVVWPDSVLPGDRGEMSTEDVQLLAADESVDPWIRAIVEGLDCCQRALVRPQQFFDGDPDHFALPRRASECLRRAHQLEPRNPTAAAMMTAVCLLEPQPEPARHWFDEAVAARCDHALAYRAFPVMLTPLVGSDRRNAMHFARECIASGRFDTQIPDHFLDIMTALCDAEPGWHRILWASPATREGVEKLLAGYEAVPGAGRYYRGLRSAAAWIGGRYAEALPLWKSEGAADAERWCTNLEMRYDTMQRDLEFTEARATQDK